MKLHLISIWEIVVIYPVLIPTFKGQEYVLYIIEQL